MPERNRLDGLDHHAHMRRAVALAASAAAKGNHPFGAILVDPSGRVALEAENTVVDDRDDTSHAELNLISAANRSLSREERNGMVLYSSAEPCAMCAAAMFWSGIRALVFGISQDALYEVTTKGRTRPAILVMSCREVFASGPNAPTTVLGPLLEDEAVKSHLGYWPGLKRE